MSYHCQPLPCSAFADRALLKKHRDTELPCFPLYYPKLRRISDRHKPQNLS